MKTDTSSTGASTPNPGSPMAVFHGCTCSLSQNRGGEGEPINGGKNHRWYIAVDCKVHSEFASNRIK